VSSGLAVGTAHACISIRRQGTSSRSRRPSGERCHTRRSFASASIAPWEKRARQQQQQLYPGMYNSVRGARPAGEVSQNDLTKQAQQLQILQRMAQMRRAQEIQAQQQRLLAQQQRLPNSQNQALAKLQMGQRPQVVVKPGIKPVVSQASSVKRPGVQAQVKAKSPKKPPETIDLSDDDDEDDENDDSEEEEESSDDEISEVTPANGDADEDSGEIMLDGAPETEEYESRPSTSKRRGRPRLDPDSDSITT